MNKLKILEKAEMNQALTERDVKLYESMVKPKTQLYGKYATLRLMFLQEKGADWVIADLPEYLKGIDRQATELYERLYVKLSASERFKKTGEYIKDVQIEAEKQRFIEEEIYNEIIYV